MYDSCKDRITESFRFLEDESGEWIRDKKGGFKTVSCGKHRNPVYIKGGEKKRPKWCKKKYGKNRRWKDMTPHPNCLFEKCPYLSMTDVEREEYIVMMKAWDKACKNGEFNEVYDRPVKPAAKKHKKGKAPIKK